MPVSMTPSVILFKTLSRLVAQDSSVLIRGTGFPFKSCLTSFPASAAAQVPIISACVAGVLAGVSNSAAAYV